MFVGQRTHTVLGSYSCFVNSIRDGELSKEHECAFLRTSPVQTTHVQITHVQQTHTHGSDVSPFSHWIWIQTFMADTLIDGWHLNAKRNITKNVVGILQTMTASVLAFEYDLKEKEMDSESVFVGCAGSLYSSQIDFIMFLEHGHLFLTSIDRTVPILDTINIFAKSFNLSIFSESEGESMDEIEVTDILELIKNSEITTTENGYLIKDHTSSTCLENNDLDHFFIQESQTLTVKKTRKYLCIIRQMEQTLSLNSEQTIYDLLSIGEIDMKTIDLDNDVFIPIELITLSNKVYRLNMSNLYQNAFELFDKFDDTIQKIKFISETTPLIQRRKTMLCK